MIHGDSEVREIAAKFGGAYSGSSVLVTGGAGFVGSWLTESLVECGAKVDCLDNFSTGLSRNIRRIRQRIRLIRSSVESAKLEGKYHYIFHMSSRASPEEYQRFPIETLMANSSGTSRVLELAQRSGSTVVFASTSEVYGDAVQVPTPESYFGNVSSIGVRSCYDEAKRFGEALCMAYFREHGTKVRIPRIFNTYGPRIRADGIYARVVPRLILQALKNEPLTIHGDGSQTRSFCYVTDTVRGLLLLASAPGIDGMVANVGNPDEMSVKELALRIIEATDSKSKLAFLEAREEDPRRRCPDISRIRKIGWKPKVGIGLGLKRTIEYFRES